MHAMHEVLVLIGNIGSALVISYERINGVLVGSHTMVSSTQATDITRRLSAATAD